MNDRVAFPLVVDGNREAEGGVADVLLYLGIEGIVLGGGMKGYEGFHFAGEAAHAVERTLGQSAGLLVIGLHLRVIKHLLPARNAQEGEIANEEKIYR